MAAQEMMKSVKLIVQVEGDTTSTGKTATKNLTFNKVILDATPDQLVAAGKAIASLQTRPLMGLRKDSSADLSTDDE